VEEFERTIMQNKATLLLILFALLYLDFTLQTLAMKWFGLSNLTSWEALLHALARLRIRRPVSLVTRLFKMQHARLASITNVGVVQLVKS
jgi:hypothetical protein